MTRKKVVLAYSGGLDTSVAIPWLNDQGWDVVAVAVDVGQSGDVNAAVERALTLGAVDAVAVEAQKELVEDFLLPALHMNALYQGRYPLVSALSRPLISKVLVETARATGAAAIAHGCTGKGNDQVRFETSLGALAPDIEVLAPVRDWDMTRQGSIEYARTHDLPIETTKESPYSIDENLWGKSIECGILEDPWASAPEDVFTATTPTHSEASREITIGFEGGVPVSIDGQLLDPIDVITGVGTIAGSFAFGRIDMIEDRLVGIKSREVYEAPGPLALIEAHSDLETLTLERSYLREKRRLESTWADLVYEGLWFSPLREGIEAFASSCSAAVTGEVRLLITPDACRAVGRRSEQALYRPHLATYEEGDLFPSEASAGFIQLWGMASREWAKNHG